MPSRFQDGPLRGPAEAGEGLDVSDRRVAITCAAALFVATIATALAAADKPPPPGFLVLAAALAILSACAYLRLRVHLSALAGEVHVRVSGIALEGLGGGFALALFLTLVCSGEPSMTVGVIDRLIWFAVCGVIGVLGASAVWALAVWMRRRRST